MIKVIVAVVVALATVLLFGADMVDMVGTVWNWAWCTFMGRVLLALVTLFAMVFMPVFLTPDE